MGGAVVVAKLTEDSASVRLAVSTDVDFTSPVYSSVEATDALVVRLSITGLTADTEYFYAIEIDGTIDMSKIGTFKTIAAGGSLSFRCAFAGDATTGSSHGIFDTIRAADPLFFIHMGDLHYQNIAVNDTDMFEAAYDAVLNGARQHQLFREVPTVYIFDDHDYGDNNSDGTSPSHDAALTTYRRRVPHYPLVETGDTDPVYFTFEVGRVMFIVTDLRSEATPDAATDNSSKTMMGTTQKTWFKSLLSDPGNSGKLFVWVCSRVWGATTGAGKDSWGGFNTERVELADHIKANCAGRFLVLSADMHALAIDDGTNHDFATGGGAPTPTFQAAPLDRGGVASGSGALYSEFHSGTPNGTSTSPIFRGFGIMDITDSGGPTLTVDWSGKNNVGTTVASLQIVVSL